MDDRIRFIALLAGAIPLICLLAVYAKTPDEDRFKESSVEAKATFPLLVKAGSISGYVIMVLAVVAVLLLLKGLQPTMTTGLVTTDVTDGDLTIRLQTESRIEVSPIQSGAVDLSFRGSIFFTGTSTGELFNGNATVSLTDLDPPLKLPDDELGVMTLSRTNSSGEIRLFFYPASGLRGETFTMKYSVVYNISTVGLTNFTGVRSGVISVTIHASDFASGWYLTFLFIGILTSFLWRLMNFFLENGRAFPVKWGPSRKIAAMLFIPVASLIIALAVFAQFRETLTVNSDPIVNATVGFAYGFFWESVTQKFGLSVASVYGKVQQP